MSVNKAILVGRLGRGPASQTRAVRKRPILHPDHQDGHHLSVDTLLADVQGQKGTLGKMVYDPSVYEQAKQLVERGNKMAADVEAGKGTLGKLVTDEALYTNVRNAASNVEQATAKLNANTGTAGRIFNDPAFYDNVTGLAGDMRLLVGEFRKDPKKFLRVKFSIF